MQIETKITGLPDFKYLISEVKNPDTTIRGFAAYRRSQFNQGIALGKDPYGTPYAPLTRRYLDRKNKKYGRRSILVASGDMKASYSQTFTSDGFTESVDFPAKYHQSGTRKMAKRMLLPDDTLPETDQEKLIQLALRNLRL